MASFLLFLAVIPVVLILLYVYSKDRNKEPTRLLVKLFLFGIISCFLTLALTDILEQIIPFFAMETEDYSKFQILIYVFIGVALIEEFSKWLMAYLIGYKSDEFDEIYDSIVYAVFVSLGFALFENLLYVFGDKNLLTNVFVGIFRGVLSVPGHACYGLYMGYFLSLAKICSHRGRPDLEKKFLALSIIVPSILHGIYDYCLMSKIDILLLVFFVFVILMFIFSIRRLKKISKDSTKLVIKNKYCSNCGSPVKGLYCSNCGTRQE